MSRYILCWSLVYLLTPATFTPLDNKQLLTWLVLISILLITTWLFFVVLFFKIWAVPTSLKRKPLFIRTQLILRRKQSISHPGIHWIYGIGSSFCLLFVMGVSLLVKETMWKPSLRLHKTLLLNIYLDIVSHLFLLFWTLTKTFSLLTDGEQFHY